MEDIFRLDGKIAVVLGGAGGLGEVIALGLSRYGAGLIVASRNMEALEKSEASDFITGQTIFVDGGLTAS